MEPSVIEEVRLTSFKSFRAATLPLDDLTLLVGRNGSGKSNALDGLWVLSRLAFGEDIRETLDGGRDGPAVRGGVEGCAPAGEQSFSLGCTVRTGRDRVTLDVTVQILPVVQVSAECLAMNGRPLLTAEPPDLDSSDIRASWRTGTKGPNPKVPFRASRLLCTQVLTRIPATKGGQRVHLAAAQLIAALRQVFVLDPVPYQMRQYVREGDTELRRNAENLSAAVAQLVAIPGNRQRIVEALNRLNEHDIVDVASTVTPLGDVMLTLEERTGGRAESLPIRLTSDGTLRFLAVLTALLQAPTIDATPDPLASEDAAGQTTMVIEELENGLHASQAVTLIGLIREEVRARRIRTLATAHSPAILDALTGAEHPSVIVCQRDGAGYSQLTRLVDLPDYFRIAALGGLGKAAEQDRLRQVPTPPSDASAFLDELLGGVGS